MTESLVHCESVVRPCGDGGDGDDNDDATIVNQNCSRAIFVATCVYIYGE